MEAQRQELFALHLPSNLVQPRIQPRPGHGAPRRGESSIRCQHKDKRTTLGDDPAGPSEVSKARPRGEGMDSDARDADELA